MEVFLFIAILLLIVSLGSFLNSLEEEARKKQEQEIEELRKELGHVKDDCPPHKWTYHPVTNKLTCTRCNYVAGS